MAMITMVRAIKQIDAKDLALFKVGTSKRILLFSCFFYMYVVKYYYNKKRELRFLFPSVPKMNLEKGR